jgi:hypothetical protein
MSTKKSKKPKQPPPGFVPADESALTGEWVLNEYVMEKLSCSINTVKKHRDYKMLPHSKLGGRIYHNTADIQHLLVMLRRLSLGLILPLIMFTDYLELFSIENLGL